MRSSCIAPEAETASKSKAVPENATVRMLTINCGRCSAAHGPYRYAEWREGNRVVTKYLGRMESTGKEDVASDRISSDSQTPLSFRRDGAQPAPPRRGPNLKGR